LAPSYYSVKGKGLRWILIGSGDTTLDIRAGKAATAQTVGVLCGFGEEYEIRRSGADLILAETADLIEILFAKPLVI
jgi:phosphoglycolate phosphatase-like HAD superfamily hydrolase